MSGADEKKPVKKPAPKKPRARTEMCIHRRKPDEYCARCDGGQ